LSTAFDLAAVDSIAIGKCRRAGIGLGWIRTAGFKAAAQLIATAPVLIAPITVEVVVRRRGETARQ